MTSTQWKTIKNFKSSEFDSPDSPGSGKAMSYDFVKLLDLLRDKLGIPLLITSGFRTLSHNKIVGGVDGSAHTRGFAADISAPDTYTKYRIISGIFSWNIPITRIGIGDRFIHLDTDPKLPAFRMWTY